MPARGGGRGRGRGRGGIPINFPDGMTCKPLPGPNDSETEPFFSIHGTGGLQTPPPLSTADKALLLAHRRVIEHPGAEAFRATAAKRPSEIVRYSDRYQNAPLQPFHASARMTMRAGVHFPAELLPSSARAGGKRKRGGEVSVGSSSRKGAIHGLAWVEDDEAAGHVADEIEAVAAEARADEGEEGEGDEGGEGQQRRLERLAQGMAEAAEAADGEAEGEGEDGPGFFSDADDDDDACFAEDYAGGYDDLETGMDDTDSDGGGDAEPTY